MRRGGRERKARAWQVSSGGRDDRGVGDRVHLCAHAGHGVHALGALDVRDDGRDDPHCDLHGGVVVAPRSLGPLLLLRLCCLLKLGGSPRILLH